MPRILPFSKKEIDKLPPAPHGGRADYYDTVQQNLILRVTGTGSKSFYVRKNKNNGQGNDRFFLGKYPDLPVEQARKQAALILARMASGEDLNATKAAKRGELTVQELFDSYIEGHAKARCTRIYDMQNDFRRYMTPWVHRKCMSITRVETQMRRNEIHQKHGPAAANHILILMRAAYNWNITNGLISGENPWGHLKQFKIQSRERFLKPEEVTRLFAELDKMSNTTIRDFILLSLYTGARRSNVLAMKWSDIDMSMGTWKIPRTKNGEWQIVPLTESAKKVLKRRQRTSEWVFPGKDPEKHLVEPKRAWQALLEAAEIEDFRLHDLRRTLGSYMAMTNQSMKMIGSALGHKSTSATEIYARIANDALRTAMEEAQAKMLNPAKAID